MCPPLSTLVPISHPRPVYPPVGMEKIWVESIRFPHGLVRGDQQTSNYTRCPPTHRSWRWQPPAPRPPWRRPLSSPPVSGSAPAPSRPRQSPWLPPPVRASPILCSSPWRRPRCDALAPKSRLIQTHCPWALVHRASPPRDVRITRQAAAKRHEEEAKDPRPHRPQDRAQAHPQDRGEPDPHPALITARKG